MVDVEYLEQRRSKLPRNSDGGLAYTLTSIFSNNETASYAQKVFNAGLGRSCKHKNIKQVRGLESDGARHVTI